MKKMVALKEGIKKIVSFLHMDFILEYLLFYYHARYYKKSKGGKKVYIFQLSSYGAGLLCVYRWGLAEVSRLIEKGHEVVIDYENPGNITDEGIGRENLWDAVFEQPCGISVEEALKKDTIILISNFTYKIASLRLLREYDSDFYRKLHQAYSRVFPLKKKWKDAWDSDFAEMFLGKRVLGVSLRELFRLMHENHAAWSARHPNEPDIVDVKAMIRNKLSEYVCDSIFLATEFEDSVEVLLAEFGDILCYTSRSRKRMTKEYVKDALHAQAKCSISELEAFIKKDADGNQDQKHLDYVKEIYGLSKCTCLLGTPSNGMLIALFWNGGKYEQVSYFGARSMEGSSYF